METVQRLKGNNHIPIIQNTANLIAHPTGALLHCSEFHTSLCGDGCRNHVLEEPIDLTCGEKRKVELPSIVKTEPSGSTGPNKRCIKRKANNKIKVSMGENDLVKYIDTSHLADNTDAKQIEVLKAARSLFSKRTRTLYHWIYPNAPKAQLKAAISTSWETLSMQEKDFYISQVLGRFGFPQSSLMINPQLGALSSIQTEFSNSSIRNVEETSNAVSTIINDTNNKSWREEIDNLTVKCTSYKKIGSKAKKSRRMKKHEKRERPEILYLKEVSEAPNDEFQDDPELNREFQQFRRNIPTYDQ